LHVERYRRGERPQEIDPPDLTEALGPAWTRLETGAYGEFDVYNYLVTAGISESAAARAAEGWGGGQIRVYSLSGGDGQEVMLHISLGWDSTKDYQQFRTAFDAAIERLNYAEKELGGLVGTWQSPREYGTAMWDEPKLRVDVLMSTNPAALDHVKMSLSEAARRR
jgi:hypothetical protein